MKKGPGYLSYLQRIQKTVHVELATELEAGAARKKVKK